jgi:hemerythrin-like metal-binding protein
MNLLQWKPEYSVGDDSIDQEHRHLIDLINETYSKLESNADVIQVDECLGDIFSAISLHFALEERMMQRLGYVDFKEHKDDHEKLLDEIRKLMDEFIEAPSSGKEQLNQCLSDWFAIHFSTFDAKFHGHFDH